MTSDNNKLFSEEASATVPSKLNTTRKFVRNFCHTARFVVMSLKIELTIADLLNRTPDPAFLGQCAIDLARELRRSLDMGTPNA
jgi:hypothetical protein